MLYQYHRLVTSGDFADNAFAVCLFLFSRNGKSIQKFDVRFFIVNGSYKVRVNVSPRNSLM